MSQTTGGVNGEFLPASWVDFLGHEAMLCLAKVESNLVGKQGFYPEKGVYRAFELCPPEKLRVVILGQDPYHGKGQAHGLAFSVQTGVKIPPSLRNIFKELKSDLGRGWHGDGDLSFWAENGVLLLNSILTVEPGKPGSHGGLGWEDFTDCVLSNISKKSPNVVFILWGVIAKKKAALLAAGSSIISGNHPAPMSANRGGFFSGEYFSKANSIISSNGEAPITWIKV